MTTDDMKRSATHQAILNALCRRAQCDPSTILARLPGPDGEPVTVARMAGALAAGEPWAREWAEDVTGAVVRMVVGRGPSEPVDLDAWRAEAGEAAALDARSTTGPWRVTTQSHDERPRTEDVCDLVNDMWVVTDHHLSNYRDDAAFIAAARTGWPRDAARVGVLCAEVTRLRALEAVATAHHDVCFGLCGCRVCAWVKASRKEPAQ